MSSHFKWNDKPEDKEMPYVVVLMISRNKDNKNVKNFKERKVSYLGRKNIEKIKRKFNHFSEDGVPGEMSRLYISLNARDTSKIKKALLHDLIDKEEIVYEHIESMVAAIAARKENALERKWFFDFDYDSETEVYNFIENIERIDSTLRPRAFKTPHGYAVVVEHGFDTRDLMIKWSDISLKRDDLICVDWRTKK